MANGIENPTQKLTDRESIRFARRLEKTSYVVVSIATGKFVIWVRRLPARPLTSAFVFSLTIRFLAAEITPEATINERAAGALTKLMSADKPFLKTRKTNSD